MVAKKAKRPTMAHEQKAAVRDLSRGVTMATQALKHYTQQEPDKEQQLQQHVTAMAKIVATLSAKINSLSVKNVKNYYIPEAKNPLMTAAFLLPAFILTAALAAGVWLFSVAGILQANTIYFLTATVACLLVLQVLLSNVRNLQLRKRVAQQSRVALDEELQLEYARSELFTTATDELQGHLFAITTIIPKGTNKAIDDAAARLLELLDRMSLISTLTRRGADYVVNSEEVDVAKLLADLVRDVKTQAKDAKVELVLDARGGHTYQLDPLLLQQAIRPVLDNAIKFSRDTEGGGYVLISYKPKRSAFELKIHDNGPGISPERRPQLFKPFSRGEDALRFNYEGAGLGLYLASLSTGLLGGTVKIDDVKQGTTFVWQFTDLEPHIELGKQQPSPGSPMHRSIDGVAQRTKPA